jgi:glycosyltransferase involved in cell wall biosynthesis
MRILAITNLYPSPQQPHRAPYNRHQFRMLGELHPLRVIAPISWTDEWAACRQALPRIPPGRRTQHDGLTVDYPRYWFTPKMLRQFYGSFYLSSVRSTFAAVHDEFRPDVIFAPWAYPDGYAAVHLAREAGLPVVVQVHGSDIRELDRYIARVPGTTAAVRDADGVIAVSQDLADRVVALGAVRHRVRVVIDGVDRQTFCPGDKALARGRLNLPAATRHLLFVGSLVPVKGLDILLAACRTLREEVGPWHLHLIGGGPLEGQLRDVAQSYGLEGCVWFHGPIAHSELPDWFRAADLFVLASRSEGVPNVLLEAAACGLPFVASRVGGIPEIANLGASRLVPSEQPAALAAAIADMLADPGPPGDGPRDRREAVAEIAQFLQSFVPVPRWSAAGIPASVCTGRSA